MGLEGTVVGLVPDRGLVGLVVHRRGVVVEVLTVLVVREEEEEGGKAQRSQQLPCSQSFQCLLRALSRQRERLWRRAHVPSCHDQL